MRYLGQFPSEQQIVDVVLDEIEEDAPSQYIKYDEFEKFMVDALMNETFEPDDPEVLMAAFKKLDEEETGELEIELIDNYMT